MKPMRLSFLLLTASLVAGRTLDRQWLAAQLPSVNLAADDLATLIAPDSAALRALGQSH